jgi:RNA polymerase sigma factor (sigma-70 family)
MQALSTRRLESLTNMSLFWPDRPEEAEVWVYDAVVGFPTTRASAVRGVRSEDEEERVRSWAALVAAYWRPVYKHVRVRWRRSPADAEDLTQGFFARAVERDFFASYDPDQARFRTFVRLCLDRFVSNENKAEGRVKRGGGTEIRSLDFDAAEAELASAPAPSPEDLFDQEWRRVLVASAIDALRDECVEHGRESHFTIFERYDLCSENARPTYDALAKDLGVPTTTVTNRLAFARRELRRLLFSSLEELTATNEERRDEARLLFGADAGSE